MEEKLHYLFKKYLDNTSSEKELEEFLDYVHRAEHDDLLRQLIEKVYNNLKDSGSETTHVDEQGRLVLTEPEWLAPVATAKEIPFQSQEVTPKRKSPKVYTKFLVAAMVVIIAGTIWIISKQGHEKPTAVSFLTKKATNRSESKSLLLEDSTQVWLNAASSLEFPDHFDSNTREVYLSGEAFFDVKHADKIPFIIHTGNISTTVLGTAFNIKAYTGQKNITISVSRGKVRVTRTDGWEMTLTKGQQVKLNEAGQQSAEI
ncbi:MAG: FecR domain-containing protein, partial [Chitinophagaceae bacterium]